MFSFNRWPIGRQIFALALVLCVLVFGALITMATYGVQASATRMAEENLRTQLKGTTDLMEYAYGQAVGRGARNGERFVKSLSGPMSLDDKLVKTGDVELPALYAGKVLLNGNTGLLEHFRDTFGSEEALLIQYKGKVYRAATLLKGKDGAYMVGSVIPKGDPLEVSFSKGEETRSIVDRNGRTYASHMLPVKDAQGRVIAAISTRVDLTADIASFKKMLLATKFGKTGYVYAFRATGDDSVGNFTLHPRLEGKSLAEGFSAHPDVLTKLRGIIASKGGDFTYLWADDKGAEREKFAVVTSVPSWGWMLAGGSYIDEFLDEAAVLRNKMIITGLVAGAAMLGLMVLLVMRRIAKLKPVLAAMQKQGEGDLTAVVDVPEGASSNEFDVLATSFNDSAARVRGLVQRLAEVSARVGGSSDALERSAGEIARATAQQSEAAASMAASVEELTVSISHVADGAGEASTATQAAQQASGAGNQAVGHSITEMRRIADGIDGTAAQINALGERSREISGIIKVIGEIAGQTNLLALNAAIEAARAGEQGRGFAVVADEVRKLSERTGNSAREISQMISGIQAETESAVERMNAVAKEMGSGVTLVQDVGASLTQIDGRTRDTAALAGQIASAVAEQKVASEDIARRLEAIAQAAEENAALTGNNRDVAQDLRNCADELAGEIGRFRV